VHRESVMLKGMKEEDLVTSGGYLRNNGWLMTIALDVKVGEAVVLEAMQVYARKLDQKYGKSAFRHFSDVDM